MASGRDSDGSLGDRRGEGGFLVLEAAIALAVTLFVALAALLALEASRAASQSANARMAALEAAEAALARIGADLPAEPGVWESGDGDSETRVVIRPFEARAELSEQASLSAPVDGGRDLRRRSFSGTPLLATATASFDGGARGSAVVSLSRVLIGDGERE